MATNPPDLIQFLSLTVRSNASDLHLTVNAPPMMRLNGELVPLAEYSLTPDWTKSLLYGVLSETQRSRFEEEWELDFALQVDGVGRFRGNAHFSRGAIEATFRYIADHIPDVSELGHWPFVAELCNMERGLLLVTGITGSGKSTTMASIVKRISETRSGVIVTIEDPIEYLFQNARCIIKQREVGNDTKSFAEALKHVLRQDPDVIMVGEMRDTETIRAAITAAETGHLVIGTLHTIDAPKAIDRMVDAFPGEVQPQIIAQLANCLGSIISQRLIPRCDVPGRALASEILVANHAVRASIRERRNEQLIGIIEMSGKDGMHTIDESLLQLLQTGMISVDEALLHARDTDRISDFRK
ncbi:MAG: PilT/PilU family type 4a pilus ATPase [Chthoniobacterales bacterium]